MKVSTVPLGKCVSISVSLLNHHHWKDCLLWILRPFFVYDLGVRLLQRHRHTRPRGRASDHRTPVVLFVVLMSAPRRGPRVDVYLSYTATPERVVAGRGWRSVLVLVAALASISSVGGRRCAVHRPRFATTDPCCMSSFFTH